MKKYRLYFCLLLLPTILVGQQTTQQLELRPGWNAIYLELTPSPSQCEAVFADVPVKSVWALAKQFNTQSASGQDWLIYHPQQPSLTELYQLQGGKSYLVELRGTESVTLRLKGKPVLPHLNWAADTFSLAGFHVDATTAPTFATFFEDVPALANKEVLKMNANGDWKPIQDLSTTRIEKGVSYWIKSDKATDFTAPIRLHAEQENCLVFGTSLTEEKLQIENTSYHDKQVQLIPQAAEYSTENLGAVPMLYWDANSNDWMPLTGAINIEVPARTTTTVRIGIDRSQMQNGTYQSILEVNDGEGTQLFMPVGAQGLNDRAGLWVGYASVNAVNYVNAVTDEPMATASDFQLRLIVHADEQGNAKMLDQVIQMWREGTYKTDPSDSTKLVVDEPGSFVLITEDALLDQYTGATLRDGKAVGRRLSTPHFSFSEPQLMLGSLEDELRLDSIFMGYDDPLNPFKHKYHPDHNNLDERYENKLGEGRESYDILRGIKLTFTAEDPDSLSIAGWGDNQVGGIYEEHIEGIHRQKLQVSGIFRLRRVSTINRLNEPASHVPPTLNTNVALQQRNALKAQPLKADLQVSPNPADDHLIVDGLIEGVHQARIINANGKVMQTFYLSGNGDINIEQLPSGTYFLEVNDGVQLQQVIFIKQGL